MGKRGKIQKMSKINIFIVLIFLLFVSCVSRKEIQHKDVAYNEEETETLDFASFAMAKEDTVAKEAPKEDEPKQEMKRRVGDVYTCDYEWDGTREWFDKQEYKDEARIKLLQEKISVSVSSDSLSEALNNEAKRWKAVTKAFDKMVDGQADLSFTSGGGSISYEYANWASVDLRFYRRSCLKEDLRSLTDSCKLEKKTISTSKLFAVLDKRVNALNVGNVYEEDLTSRRGGVAGYKKELAACKKQVKRVKAAFNAWIEARRDVSNMLNENAGSAYLHHTQKALNSLAEGF